VHWRAARAGAPSRQEAARRPARTGSTPHHPSLSSLSARDHCAGACAQLVANYVKEVRDNYGCKDKRPALEICKRAVACIAACEQAKTTDGKRDACRAACKKSRAAGCHEGFIQDVDLGNCFAYESPI
jgi:hypothetical protein